MISICFHTNMFCFVLINNLHMPQDSLYELEHGVTVDLPRWSNGHASDKSFTNIIDNHVQGLIGNTNMVNTSLTAIITRNINLF